MPRRHSRSPTTTRVAPVSTARATAHDPTAQAWSGVSAETVTVPLPGVAEMPKSFFTSAATFAASPAVFGSCRAHTMPAWVWPDSTDAVTRACASCWA